MTGAGVEALRRVAYVLERAHEPTYRVKAFRTAAATIDELPPGELSARLAAGTLEELKGVGSATAGVVVEAERGDVPAYLTKVEALPWEPADVAAGAGATLRAALRGDCHTHSDWSDGGSPIAEMARAARDLGHEWMVLTDHSPRLTVANGLTAERLRRQLDVVARAQRGARAVPDPDRHRGRHPRGRLARPGPAAARPSWTSSSPACTPSCGCRART